MSLPPALQTAPEAARVLAAPGLALAAGPLRLDLQLDASLQALVPEGWRSQASSDPADSICVRLSASPAEAFAHEQKWRPFDAAGLLLAGSCRLQRLSPALFEGTCVAGLPALTRTIRFASQPALLRLGWLLLHASSVRLADGVHLFVAPSGTGKSTLARRLVAAGAERIGDEVALVGEGRAAAHPGQVVHGLLGAQHRLARIHLLARGAPQSSPVRPAEAIAALLGEAMVYEEGQAGHVLGVVERLVATTPVVRTRVPNDDSAVRLFSGLFEGEGTSC